MIYHCDYVADLIGSHLVEVSVLRILFNGPTGSQLFLTLSIMLATIRVRCGRANTLLQMERMKSF